MQALGGRRDHTNARERLPPSAPLEFTGLLLRYGTAAD
jgi:hypothetical protein